MEILSQTTTPAGPTTQPAPRWFQFIASYGPIILIILVFYFLVFGSKKKQERQRQDMINQLKKGDRIQTIGGILGTVIEIRDSDVLVKVDESSNTKIRFSRSAVHRVVEEEKSENK